MLQLVRSSDNGVFKSCHSQFKKDRVPCHEFVDKLLDEWSARELRASGTENLGDYVETVLDAEEFCRIIYSRYVSHMTNRCILKDLI